ncbi:MAG: hypothetical protein JWL76_2368 [Thermoleophilia bacterium]|nr:hypothetical protein [Thermoleophilia bacterium]
MHARTLLAIAAMTTLALTAPAAQARNGDRGTTPPTTPSTSSVPCVELTARDGGVSPGELRFEARSCSSQSFVLSTVVDDWATRVLYPTWDCGYSQYAGPTITLPAGRTMSFSIPTRRGTCAIGAAESHSVSLTALAPDAAPISTTWTSWSERSAAESR